MFALSVDVSESINVGGFNPSVPSFLPSVSQLDTPAILSPQLLMFLLVYVIIYKLTLWNMNA